MPRKATEVGLGFAGIVVFLVFLSVATSAVIPKLGVIEGMLHPVNKVTVMEIVGEAEDGDVLIQGRFDKLRDCQFVRSQWHKGEGVEIEFERVDEVQQLPAGRGLTWGVLRLNVSRDTAENDIFVHTYHRCHPFWLTRTTTWKSH